MTEITAEPGGLYAEIQLRKASLAPSRYLVLTPLSGCPHCGGATLGTDNCLNCGWDGPTRAPAPGERRRVDKRWGYRQNRKRGGVVYPGLSTKYLQAVRRG